MVRNAVGDAQIAWAPMKGQVVIAMDIRKGRERTESSQFFLPIAVLMAVSFLGPFRGQDLCLGVSWKVD
jgi:hypothetical protein